MLRSVHRVWVTSRDVVKGIGGEKVEEQPAQSGPSLWMPVI